MTIDTTDITAAIRRAPAERAESERRDVELFLEAVDFKTVDLGSAYERRTLLAELALALEYVEAPELMPLFMQVLRLGLVCRRVLVGVLVGIQLVL